MEHLLPALVARRFYIDGASKSQIAEEFGVSRFRVARILDAARRDGIVRIEIISPPEVDGALSVALAERFGLHQAVVVRNQPDAGSAEVEPRLGEVCARMLAETVEAGDVLGVSWGRTLHAMAAHLPALPPIRVVQLVGSVPTAELGENSLDLLRRLSECTGGPVHPLHVPLAVDSPDVVRRLADEGHVRATTALYPQLTRALVGIGAWRPGGSSLRAALPPDLVSRADALGAVADVCCTVLAADGTPVLVEELAERCVAITAEQLGTVPDVLAVAGGHAKAGALAAAARSGLIDRLVTDSEAAERMLDGT